MAQRHNHQKHARSWRRHPYGRKIIFWVLVLVAASLLVVIARKSRMNPVTVTDNEFNSISSIHADSRNETDNLASDRHQMEEAGPDVIAIAVDGRNEEDTLTESMDVGYVNAEDVTLVDDGEYFVLMRSTLTFCSGRTMARRDRIATMATCMHNRKRTEAEGCYPISSNVGRCIRLILVYLGGVY